MQTVMLKSGAYHFDIHFWLGKDTTQVCSWQRIISLSVIGSTLLRVFLAAGMSLHTHGAFLMAVSESNSHDILLNLVFQM